MNIDTYNEAVELRNKINICETVMKYLSDPDAVKGMRYKEHLALFVKMFDNEFMMFVHEQLVRCSEMFEELHCCPDCECENKSTEIETPPADAKFQMGDKVEIIGGDIAVFIGRTGVIVGYVSAEEMYQVRLDGFSEESLPQLFVEDELKIYAGSEEKPSEKPEGPPELTVDDVEVGEIVRIIESGKIGEITEIIDNESVRILLEDETSVVVYIWGIEKIDPENPEEEEPDYGGYAVGDVVYVKSGYYEGLVGTIVGFDETSNSIKVRHEGSDEVSQTIYVNINEIEKYPAPENENEDGGDTDPAEGE